MTVPFAISLPASLLLVLVVYSYYKIKGYVRLAGLLCYVGGLFYLQTAAREFSGFSPWPILFNLLFFMLGTILVFFSAGLIFSSKSFKVSKKDFLFLCRRNLIKDFFLFLKYRKKWI